MTPLMGFALSWTCGILLAYACNCPAVWGLVGLPLSLTLWLGWGDRRASRWAALALVGLMGGFLRMRAAQPSITPSHIAFYRDQGPVDITGVVVADPDRRVEDTRLVVQVERLSLRSTSSSVEGKVLVRTEPYAEVAYGDRIQASGDLRTPPVYRGFSYQAYLARQGIYALMDTSEIKILAAHQANPILEGLLALRARAHRLILRTLPEPQASLLSGILLGLERGIPPETLSAFSRTGAIHIIAISGFNLTLAAGVITLIVHRFLPRQATLLVAWLGIWGYVLLVGASAAVLRAGVMSSVMVLAQTAQRRVHAPTSLAAAVVFLSALNPTILWDVGFLLSVTATVGLLCYAPLLARGLMRWLTSMVSEAHATRIVSLLNEALIVTIAVQLTTLGILVAQFRTLTLVAPLTNLLILPVQPFVMLFGVGTVLGGLIWAPLALVPGWLSWAFLAYTTTVVTWTASFPWAAIDLHAVPTLFPTTYYVLLGGVTLWATHTREVNQYARAWLTRLPRPVWAALVAGAALLVSYGASRPDGRLHVTFLDVSGGEAVLIQSPSGRQMLVDGGRDPRASLAALGSALPFWDRTLDAVVLTAPDQDRLAGLVEVLDRYQVDLVVSGTSDPTGTLAARWQSALEAKDRLSQRRVSQGDVLPLDESVTVHVLWPPMGHPGPLVLQVRDDKARLLIMSDATTMVEETLVATYGAALHTQVLLLPRYGAETCCRPDFLQAVSPELAMVGPGRGRTLDSGVWARLMDVELYQVGLVGAVDVTWEGDILHVHTDTP